MGELPKDIQPVIFGCEGTVMTEAEKAFFAEVKPLGFILFQRNCESPQQLRALTDSFKELTGRDELLILIDQEGGRVTRMKPPHWRAAPAMGVFAQLYQRDKGKAERATYLNARLLAQELHEVGFTVDCIPVLDLPTDNADAIISDRALGTEPEQVTALAKQVIEGLKAGGVLPVMKHMPGHGRATVDSHEALPVVTESLAMLEKTDFAPFKALNNEHLGMTAHIIYEALDAEEISSFSPKVVQYIRKVIGFDGLLMSDDFSMKALSGDYTTRTEKALSAGCDIVLHCNGKMEEMQPIAEGLKPLTDDAKDRAERALAEIAPPKVFDVKAAQSELDALLA